jgi:hypothetical protein
MRPERTLLSLDFRAAAVARRLGCLDDGPDVHVPLEPPPGQYADAEAYARALVDQAAPAEGDVVLVAHCAAFGLVPDVESALDEGGTPPDLAVAVDPVTPTGAEVREALRETLEQLCPPEQAAREAAVDLPPPGVAAAELGALVGRLAVPIEREVARSFGVAAPDGLDSVPVARELADRYATWLQYVLACYAGTRRRPSTRVVEVEGPALEEWLRSHLWSVAVRAG